MNFINEYLGLGSAELNGIQITSRLIVVIIAFLLYLKISGVNFSDIKKGNTLDYLITSIVIFILISSIFTVNSFPAYLISILVFAILLRILNPTTVIKKIKQKDENLN
jgi:hypothetical protein